MEPALSTPEHSDTPQPKRRRFQYSLRTLLLFMLLVSIGLSWFTVKMQQASRQREAVEAIRELSGWVGYDTGIRAPKWVRDLFGR